MRNLALPHDRRHDSLMAFIKKDVMEYIINHDPGQKRFTTVVDGYTAYVEYSLQDGVLDIIHTIVPRPVGGRGIAAALVKKAYEYASEHGLERAGTCPYAARWMERHRY